MIVPAMNVRMWLHPATQANPATPAARGIVRVGPTEGDMACGEYGTGRMAAVTEFVAAIEAPFADRLSPGAAPPRPPPGRPAPGWWEERRVGREGVSA